jgi:hypothetical protein
MKTFCYYSFTLFMLSLFNLNAQSITITPQNTSTSFTHNVGIGTSNPTQPLSFANQFGGKISFLRVGNSHFGFGIQGDLFQMYTAEIESDIAFGWGKSELFNETMRIKGNGLVGIGIATPTATLDVRRKSIVTANFVGSEIASHFHFGDGEHTYLRGGKIGSNLLLNDYAGAGNVGIGTGSPLHTTDIQSNSSPSKVHLRLHENDLDFSRMRFTNNSSVNYWDVSAYSHPTNDNYSEYNIFFLGLNQNVLSLRGDGNAVLRGTLTQLSDRRLKQNITLLNHSLEKILMLNGYQYRWTDEKMDTELQSGFIAQEVQELFPNLVKQDESGMLSVNYSGLIPELIEAIKSQQKQIDELKKR